MKKTKILYILLIIIILCIGLITCIYASNKLNIFNKNIVDDETTDIKDDKNTSKWYYRQAKIEPETEDVEPGDMSLSYIVFKDSYIDICYQDNCYSAKYTIEDNILHIEEGEYFSGEFKISYEKDKLYLREDFSRGFSVIHIFTKEDN